MTAFQALADALSSSELAAPATWQRNHAPADPVMGEVMVLLGKQDTDLSLGTVRASKDARKIRVQVGQGWVPTVEDTVTIGDLTWRIRNDATLDRRGAFWQVDLAR